MGKRLINPSPKEKEFAKEYMENGGNGTAAVKKVFKIRNHGTAKVKAHRLLTSDNLKDIFDKYLPDDLLAKKHQELLNKQEVIAKNNMSTGEIDILPTGELDVQAVSKGLDMAYKLKGKYAPEKREISGSIVSESELTDEDRELLEIMRSHGRNTGTKTS